MCNLKEVEKVLSSYFSLVFERKIYENKLVYLKNIVSDIEKKENIIIDDSMKKNISLKLSIIHYNEIALELNKLLKESEEELIHLEEKIKELDYKIELLKEFCYLLSDEELELLQYRYIESYGYTDIAIMQFATFKIIFGRFNKIYKKFKFYIDSLDVDVNNVIKERCV